MKVAKYSKADIELLSNSKVIDEKNRVLKQIEKQFTLLGNTSFSEYKFLSEQDLPPKVSKGENLEGYPFRVLDYPRIFSKNDVFAFRTLFWWGNFISLTLHLKGKYLLKNFDQLKQLLNLFEFQLHISSSGDEWIHDVNDKNYEPLNSETLAQIQEKEVDFLKIVQVEPLDKINQLNKLYQVFLNRLIVPLCDDNN